MIEIFLSLQELSRLMHKVRCKECAGFCTLPHPMNYPDITPHLCHENKWLFRKGLAGKPPWTLDLTDWPRKCFFP